MLHQPLVSIITPSFRSFRFIAETIESVEQQDYPCIEHIIIDGNSDDGTVDILKKYPRLIWISEPDKGQSHALNKGFKMAKGEIVGWLNADDVYSPGAVSVATRFLLENEDVDLVYSDQQIVDENNKLLAFSGSKPFDLTTLFTENFIRQPTVFMRRNVIEQMGGVDENLHYCMDRELWLRVGSSFRMQYLPNTVSANFRLCAGTKTFEHEPSFHAEWLKVLERSLTEPRCTRVPNSVKYKAIQQAQVRFRVAHLKKALKSHDMNMFSSQLSSLLIHNWKYILYYPIKKIVTFLQR
jgi:glycosyltransferase involved in cell wall biosynthesis